MRQAPDESRILELSARCAPPEAFEVAAELRALLTERGIDVSGEQRPRPSERWSSSRGHA
jgi:hypothetical protein